MSLAITSFIGDQKPQHEYIRYEPVIEEVYTFHIYKIIA